MLKNLYTQVLVLLLLLGSALQSHASDEKKATANPIVLLKTSAGDIRIELFPAAAPKTVANFIDLAEGKKEFIDAKTKQKATRPFYDGLIFHRVIKDFMLQGGCPLGTGTSGPGYNFEDEINAKSLQLDQQKVATNNKPHPWLGISSQQDYQQLIVAPLLKKMGIDSDAKLEKNRAEVNKKIAEMSLLEAYQNLGYKYSDSLTSLKPDRGALAMANAGPETNGSQFFINVIDTPWLTGKHTVFGKVVSGMDVVDKISKVPVDDAAKPTTAVTIISIRLVK